MCVLQIQTPSVSQLLCSHTLTDKQRIQEQPLLLKYAPYTPKLSGYIPFQIASVALIRVEGGSFVLVEGRPKTEMRTVQDFCVTHLSFLLSQRVKKDPPPIIGAIFRDKAIKAPGIPKLLAVLCLRNNREGNNRLEKMTPWGGGLQRWDNFPKYNQLLPAEMKGVFSVTQIYRTAFLYKRPRKQ